MGPSFEYSLTVGRRSLTVIHTPRLTPAALGLAWNYDLGKRQNPLNLPAFQPSHLPTFQLYNLPTFSKSVCLLVQNRDVQGGTERPFRCLDKITGFSNENIYLPKSMFRCRICANQGEDQLRQYGKTWWKNSNSLCSTMSPSLSKRHHILQCFHFLGSILDTDENHWQFIHTSDD